MKNCPICQGSILDSALKCSHCGVDLKHCSACGTLLLASAEICPSCDTNLIQIKNENNYNNSRQKAIQNLELAGAKTQGATVVQSSQNNKPFHIAIDYPTKSYTWQAVLTLVLYYVGFWIVGFIANLIFLSDIKKERERTGNNPTGSGCLSFLLFIHVTLPILLIIGAILLAIIAPGILADIF